jgi:hypothetical protein
VAGGLSNRESSPRRSERSFESIELGRRHGGGELELELPFGVARQLFEPPLRAATPAAREMLLAGAGGLALAVVGEAAGERDAQAERRRSPPRCHTLGMAYF